VVVRENAVLTSTGSVESRTTANYWIHGVRFRVAMAAFLVIWVKVSLDG
jgi:hypothetical protein